MKSKNASAPTAAGLPDLCYSLGLTDGACIIIKKGVEGYYPTTYGPGYTDQMIDDLNTKMGVTPAQRMAMEIGSMVGWHVPGADPAAHVERMVKAGRMEVAHA